MRNLILLFFIGFSHFLGAQVNDNFDDGDFNSNPVWQGNTNDFTIDVEKKLRLNASQEGFSQLYTNFLYPDSFVLNIDVKLEFSPSGTNYTRLYFLSTSDDINAATTYYLNIGENGSNDAIRVYLRDHGSDVLLGSGQEGAMSADPSKVSIKISYKNQGQFTVEADYDQNGIF